MQKNSAVVMELGLLLGSSDAKKHLDHKITPMILILLSIVCLKMAISSGESTLQFSRTGKA